MTDPQQEQQDLEQMRKVHESYDRHCARYRKRNFYSREYAAVVKALRSWRTTECK